MKLCLLGILMDLFALKKVYATHQGRIIRAAGEMVLLPCEKDSPYTRWFWFPLTSRCANISGESVEITWGPAKHNVTPIRFNQRLAYQSPGSLLLRNLVMSDEGSYVCRLPNGSETRTILEVTTGCHNNLTVSSHWLNPSSLRLSCRPCQSVKAVGGFYWLLNSERLGRRRWAQKSHSGSYITLSPIRPVVWGRWECRSIANPTWVSEICLKPHTMEEEASLWKFPPSTTWSPAAAPEEPEGKGIKVWMWGTLSAGLALVPVLGIAVCFWKRKLAGRNNQRKKKIAQDHASLGNLAGVLLQQNELLPRESLEETTASLHYAQLRLPPGKSSFIRTADSTTVYAVVV